MFRHPLTRTRIAAMGGLLLFVAAAPTPEAPADLLVEEQFLNSGGGVGTNDESAGEYYLGGVEPQSPTVLGFDGADAWFGNSTSVPNIIENGLTYTNASGTVASAGGSLRTDSNNNRGNRQMDVAFTGATTGTYYVSFMLRVSSIASSSNYKTFGFYNGVPGQSTRVLTIGTTSSFGDDFYLNTQGTDASLGDADTDTNFFVLRLDFSSVDDSDSVTVYRNPDLVNEPGSGVNASDLNLAFDHVALERFASQSLEVDELRIGNTYNDVTTAPIPEPTTLALVGMSGLLIGRRPRCA